MGRYIRAFTHVLIGFVFLLAAGSGFVSAAQQEEKYLFIGDGFVITQDDVTALKRFFEEGGVSGFSFTSNDEEYKRVSLQMRLFAEEAKNAGLVEKQDKEEVRRDSVEELIRTSDRYLKMLIENYQLDEMVIVSYYRAHPEQYLEPLDDSVKEGIRRKINMALKQRISSDAFEKLKLKYNVRSAEVEKGMK